MRWKGERNTTKFGQQFKASIIEAVWEKAHAMAGFNPDKFRKDACGALMVKSSFGKNSQFGWEIDHIFPFPKEEKMILITFNRFIGKTMKARPMIIPIGFAL